MFVILVMRCDVHILFREAIQILRGKCTLHDLSKDLPALMQEAHNSLHVCFTKTRKLWKVRNVGFRNK